MFVLKVSVRAEAFASPAARHARPATPPRHE
jgi:hypothetical protein